MALDWIRCHDHPAVFYIKNHRDIDIDIDIDIATQSAHSLMGITVMLPLMPLRQKKKSDYCM